MALNRDEDPIAQGEAAAHGSDLGRLLRWRAMQAPDRIAYRFVRDADGEASVLTYRQLDRHARQIAACIQFFHPAGSHALVLYPPSLDYVAALFGCFYAGVVAVPANWPRRARDLQRLEAVMSHAAVDFVLSSADGRNALARRSIGAAVLDSISVITTDQLSAGSERDWVEPSCASRSLALLQYTSGSTGSPKGVMISHGNIIDNVSHLVARADLSPASIGVSWLPPFHDMGLMGGVIAPLYAGFPVTLMSPASFVSHPLIWLQAITRYRGTVSVAPNFGYELCLAKVQAEQMAELDLSTWDVAFCGSEPIRADTLDRFAGTFAKCGFRRRAFFPCYGLAEATLMVSGGPKCPVPRVLHADIEALEKDSIVTPGAGKRARRLVACGRPVPEGSVVIVDPLARTCCEDRHVGEIWVRSESVGGGYWNRPEETRETFGARLAVSDQGPFLRTGDLGFLDQDHLYITGRIKDLIIIRGVNHHPQDIEVTVERSHQGLRPHAGAAFSIDDAGEERLVVVQEIDRSWRGDTSRIADAIRKSIAEEHGLAARAIVLIKQDTIPRTTSGKIQRNQARMAFESGTLAIVAKWSGSEDGTADALLAPAGAERAVLATGPVLAPDDDRRIATAQSVIVRELARILDRPEELIQVEAPLSSFALDSLRIFELQAAIAAQLTIDLDSVHFFEDHNIVELARIAANCAPACAVPPLASRLRDSDPLPLSFVQERLWFLTQLQPDDRTYNNMAAARLTGPLNIAALEASLSELISRHEVLRTRFVSRDGSPRQVIDGHTGFRLDVVDLSGLPAHERAGELDRWSEQEAVTPFALSAGRLFRVRLLRLDRDEHVLLVSAHHIVSDAWSLRIAIREISELYGAFAAGKPSPLPQLPVQYADYAAWQRHWLQGGLLEQQASYWKEQLARAPTVLDLPTDRIRPAMQSFTGAVQEFRLSQRLTKALARLAHAEGATPFMVLLAAFQLLLGRWSGQDDIVVGTPIAGRRRRQAEGLIGFFVNMVALRTNLGGDPSFRELLQRVKKVAVEAYDHQDIPFEKVLEVISPDRTLSHTPIFQVVLNMLGTGEQVIDIAGLKFQIQSQTNPSSKFDLTLYVEEASKRLTFKLVYDAALFRQGRMAEFLHQFASLLAQVVRNPDEQLSGFSLLTPNAKRVLPDPKRRLGNEWYGAVHQLFSQQAARRPDWPASLDGAAGWSYRELDEISNRVASYLRANGVETGDIVAILGHRSAPLVWAILGTLKAGAAFTILDPTYPAARLIACLEAARPRAWLEIAAGGRPHQSLSTFVADLGCCRVQLQGPAIVVASRVVTDVPASAPNVAVGPNDAAVVTFTSGSTGRPKAILGRHGPLSHFIPWLDRTFGFNRWDRFSMVSGISHDPLQRDIFTPLCVGATICIPDSDEITMPGGMAKWMHRNRVTVAHLTPGLGQILSNVDDGGETGLISIGSLRYAFLVGDVLTRRDVAALRAIAPSLICVNYYGSTETQRSVGYYVVPDDHEAVRRGGNWDKENLPLGKGIEDVQLLVLNRRGCLAGIGELGEIHMRSCHMAAGYLGNDGLTAERFFINPFTTAPGDRLYRTGDLGRYLPDGNVEFAGRADREIKLRGHRIELGEIEAALRSHADVKDAVVVAREDDPGEKRLVGYVVGGDGAAPDRGALRAHVKQSLPDYMVPSAFVVLETLPLTPNGKVDRKSLPAPEGRPESADYVAPRTPTEEVLAGLWAEVLKIEKVGVNDNFFDVGGHSLLLLQLHRKLKVALDHDFSLMSLFRHPTIRSFEAFLGEELASRKPTDAGRDRDLVDIGRDRGQRRRQ